TLAELPSLDDLRVVNNGEDLDRWASSDGSKLWTLLTAPPALTATLAENISDSDDELTVSDPEKLVGWPEAGFLLAGTECIQYSAITGNQLTLANRGARNTTAAAHSLGATLRYVEHGFLDLLYGNTGA